MFGPEKFTFKVGIYAGIMPRTIEEPASGRLLAWHYVTAGFTDAETLVFDMVKHGAVMQTGIAGYYRVYDDELCILQRHRADTIIAGVMPSEPWLLIKGQTAALTKITLVRCYKNPVRKEAYERGVAWLKLCATQAD